MRILHFIYAEGINGGAEKYLRQLLPGLQSKGIQCNLFIACPPASFDILTGYSRELEAEGIATKVVAARPRAFFRAAKELARYCRKTDTRVVHCHLINSDLIAVIAKIFFLRKLFLISTKHGYRESVLQEYDPANPLKTKDGYFYFTRFLLKLIDRNISVSRGLANLYLNLGLTRKSFPVIYHGVNEPAEQTRSETGGFRRSNQQIIMVGRLKPFKGHRYLIEAMKDVLAVFPDAEVLLLGEGDGEKDLKDLAARLHLEHAVVFKGFQENAYQYICNSDVMVLPSLFEPFGLVFIEAFAAKVPVVAFDVPAGNEIIKNEKTGLLSARKNVGELAKNIIRLLQNEDERNRISQAAYAEYNAKFTVPHMIENTANWYRREIPATAKRSLRMQKPHMI